MPYISVKVAGILTKKQKEDIVSQITETMLNSEVVHIGYYSTEVNSSSNVVREIDQSSNEGNVSVLQNLKVFNDIKLLDNIRFQSDKSLWIIILFFTKEKIINE